MTLPDFTLRLLTDPAGQATAWFDFVKTLVATFAGAALAFWSTRAVEKARSSEERHTLTAAAGAEIKASLAVLTEVMSAAQEHDPDHNADTVTFARLPDDPTPLVRAAFEKAGKFPPSLASELARFVLLQRQFRQQVDTLQAMHSAGLLTEKKDAGRRLAAAMIAGEMHLSMQRLDKQFDEYIAKPRGWWVRRS